MSIFNSKHEEIEQHETMMGVPLGRLAVTLDLLTDALVLTGQHGVYCRSASNVAKPAKDLELVLESLNGAKELVQSVMAEMRKSKAGAS